MKTIYYIVCVSLFMFSGCAEDKGNYDYTKINDVAISGISGLYTVNNGGEIKIPVTLTNSLGENGRRFSYSWEINGNVVSTDKDLNYTLPKSLGFGSKICRYSVTDEETGMKFFRRFNITVVSPFNWGYYMLCEAENGETMISYMPVRTEDNEGQELNVVHTTDISGIAVGRKPSCLSGTYSSISGLDYGWTITCMTEEGEYPVIVTNNITFIPSGLMNASSFVDPNAGYVFKPQMSYTERGGSMALISNGQHIAYRGGFLYRPAQHKDNYYWSNAMRPVTYGTYWAYVFDELSKKYYLIRSYPSDIPSEGIYRDSYAYDMVLPITDFPSLEGHTIIAAPQGSGSTERVTVVTANEDGVNFITFSYTYDATGTNHPVFDGKVTLVVDGAGPGTKAISGTNDWYFGIGNEIYTTPILLPVISEFVKLPEEYGEITDLKLSAQGKFMIATTYNSATDAQYKGSLFYIDMTTKEVTAHPNIIHRCVSLLSCNGSTPNFPARGDGN